MHITAKRHLHELNLPRLGQPLGLRSPTDYEQVGQDPNRTAKDAFLTAANNAIAVVEDIGKAMAMPVLGVVAGVGSAITGEGPPGLPRKLTPRGRLSCLLAGPTLGAVGAVIYGVHAVVDGYQAGAALTDAAIKTYHGH